MNWLTLTIISFILFAISNLMDKYLIGKVLSSAKAYTFIVGVLSLFSLSLSPWFLFWPGYFPVFISILIGVAFLSGAFCLFSALSKGETFRVIVFVGSLSQVIYLLFTVFFLDESFGLWQWLGASLLLIGSFFSISISGNKSYIDFLKMKLTPGNKAFNETIRWSLSAALLFAIYLFGVNYIYHRHDFLNSFILIRIGVFITALFFLIRKEDRKEIFASLRGSKNIKYSFDNDKNKLIIFSQSVGAMAALLQAHAFSIGSVALISSYQVLQYIALLAFSLIAVVINPRLFGEKGGSQLLWQKISTLAVITAGACLINL